MKTILDKIQARHDEQSAYERGDAGLPDVIWDDMFYIAHADRQALLDIIRDIEKFADGMIIESHIRRNHNMAYSDLVDRSEELMRIINRTEP